MKTRWWFPVVFALTILIWGCGETEEPVVASGPEPAFFPLTMENLISYFLDPGLFTPQRVPTTDPFHPVCKEFNPGVGPMGCEASIRFLYCGLCAPIVHNGTTFDQLTALDQCETGTDVFWRRFRRCANTFTPSRIIDCLESNGAATEFADLFDIDSVAPEFDATNRTSYSALNYRQFIGNTSGPNQEDYQVWLGIRDGGTGEAAILFIYNHSSGLYDSESIGAIGGNIPGMFPSTDFWLAGIDIHITDLFLMTMDPYAGVLRFGPVGP